MGSMVQKRRGVPLSHCGQHHPRYVPHSLGGHLTPLCHLRHPNDDPGTLYVTRGAHTRCHVTAALFTTPGYSRPLTRPPGGQTQPNQRARGPCFELGKRHDVPRHHPPPCLPHTPPLTSHAPTTTGKRELDTAGGTIFKTKGPRHPRNLVERAVLPLCIYHRYMYSFT